MEALQIMAAVALGWLLAIATRWLISLPDRHDDAHRDKRQVYARLLATSAALSQSAGYIVHWESDRGQRRTGPAAVTALSELVSQMEAGILATRQLVAEVRLIGGPAIADEASALSRVAEQTVLLVRYQPSVTTWRREWPSLETRWRETTHAFEELARSELGTQDPGRDSLWGRLRRRPEP